MTYHLSGIDALYSQRNIALRKTTSASLGKKEFGLDLEHLPLFTTPYTHIYPLRFPIFFVSVLYWELEGFNGPHDTECKAYGPMDLTLECRLY